MVNANKHRALKVLNEKTKRERAIRQYKNDKEYYNKNKFDVNSICNLNKTPFRDLELRYRNKGGL